MNNKLLTGLFAGIVAGVAVSVLIKFKKHDSQPGHEDNFFENDMLDSANDYLLAARVKSENMVKDAEEKSRSILDEAGKILSLVKEKTALMNENLTDKTSDEAEKLKEEIENQIRKFKNKI